jgi:2-methylaconitate cis-trans-isomerase PrpF
MSTPSILSLGRRHVTRAVRGRRPLSSSASASGHAERSFPALFARGGTSNGLVIQRRHLPPEAEWHKVLPSAMGSPDPYGRQLDGVGSGISSTSKVVILSPPSRPGVDVDYTFVQVGIRDGTLDMAGNCGNMSAVVGPASLDEGLVPEARLSRTADGATFASVSMFNTNTSKLIISRFRVTEDPPRYCPDGDYAMDGVPGTSSRITLSFVDPAGAKTGVALPTGNPVDTLRLSDGSAVAASLVDVGNPGVFVNVASIRQSGSDYLSPAEIDADVTLRARLEEIRRVGASMMGLDPSTESVPKIVLLFPRHGEEDVDIRCLAMSMGQAHKAVPLTLALCLGAAAQMPGTIAAEVRGGGSKPVITIGHPSGKVDIGTTVEDGRIVCADLHRTARYLIKGRVFY